MASRAFGLSSAALARSEHGPALSLADGLLEIAHRQHSPEALATAHYAQAMPRQYLGDLSLAAQESSLLDRGVQQLPM